MKKQLLPKPKFNIHDKLYFINHSNKIDSGQIDAIDYMSTDKSFRYDFAHQGDLQGLSISESMIGKSKKEVFSSLLKTLEEEKEKIHKEMLKAIRASKRH